MGKPDKAGEENGTIEAIRSLVEENELALQSLEDEVLTLDDIVWRSPARQIVDTTDIIQRLAEEADKVANGQAAEPPRAALHHGGEPIIPLVCRAARSPGSRTRRAHSGNLSLHAPVFARGTSHR